MSTRIVAKKSLLMTLVAIVASLAACGGSTSSSAPASAASGGSGQSLANLNIGFFAPGSANQYAALVTSSAADEASKLGVKLTTLSANFDAKNQANQLQLALSRKTYNAWVVVPLDVNSVCGVLNQAIAAGIKVELANSDACGVGGPPGAVGFSGVQTPDLYAQWWNYILSKNAPGKIVMLKGGALDYLTKISDAAMNAALAAHPGFTLVSNANLDYSTSAAFNNVQVQLQAHTDITIIASDYAGMTQGAVQAVKTANKTGSVKIYDFNGGQAIVDLIKSGDVEMTIPGMPISESRNAVRIIADAWQGKPTPKTYNPITELTFPGSPFVTKTNVNDYKPQY